MEYFSIIGLIFTLAAAFIAGLVIGICAGEVNGK